MRWGMTTLLVHWMGVEKVLKLAAENGYEAIELNCVRDYYAHFNALQLADSPEMLASLKTLLGKYHLDCSAVDCHGLFGRSPDQVEYTERYLRASFRIAEALQSRIVITSIPAMVLPYPEMIRHLNLLTREAQERELQLAIEAEANFGINPDTMAKALEDVDNPALGINMDPSHFAMHQWDIPTAIRTFRNRIVHVHLKEYLPESAFPTCYTGLPGSPCSQMLDELASGGYQGYASAETLADLSSSTPDAPKTIMAGIRAWEKRKASN